MSPDRTHLTPGADPFGLRELPLRNPPDDRWPAVAAKLRQAPRAPRHWLLPAAAAALFAGSLGLIVLLRGELDAREREVERWITYSQLLEAELIALRDDSSVLRGHEALATSELEDLVAQVDQRLASVPSTGDRLTLWQQRAAILDDLVTVHALAQRRRWQAAAEPVPVVTRHLAAPTRATADASADRSEATPIGERPL